MVSLEFTKTDKTALASDNSQILFCNARIYNAGIRVFKTDVLFLSHSNVSNKQEREREGYSEIWRGFSIL